MTFADKKLILFDLDGTLIDSAPDLARAVNHMRRHFGMADCDIDTVHHWVGNGAQMLVCRALLGRRDIDEAEIDPLQFEEGMEVFMTYYRTHLAVDTVTYPGVKETLRQLQQRGYRLAIVTNKPYAFVPPILQGLDLADCFVSVLGGDSLPEKKPDPSPLLHLCHEQGVPVSESLMVGDSRNDILAAQAAGMQVIGVSYGYNYGESISIYQPDAVVDHFAEIITLLQEERHG